MRQLPDLLSNTLDVVKPTSLGSVVAVPELVYQARQAQSITYNPTPIVVAASCISCCCGRWYGY
jgi:polar amino acid transport system permease protein